MKQIGVSKIDDLGRLRIPVELRGVLGWSLNSNIAIHYVDGNTAILQLVAKDDCGAYEQNANENVV